jgi:hypothetical protein
MYKPYVTEINICVLNYGNITERIILFSACMHARVYVMYVCMYMYVSEIMLNVTRRLSHVRCC